MPPLGQPHYKVRFSGAIRELILKLAERATLLGRLSEFLNDLDIIGKELETRSLDWGEARTRQTHSWTPTLCGFSRSSDSEFCGR